MKMDIASVIKSAKIFASLDDDVIQKLATKFETVYLAKNQILFHQGELSDELYIVASGKVAIILQESNKSRKVVREVSHSDTFGEIAAISHEARSASAMAIEDSILLKLSSVTFNEISQKYPSVILQAMNVFVTRSRNLFELLTNNKPTRKHIAIVPANDKSNLSTFFDHLKNQIANISNVVLLSESDKMLQQRYPTEASLHELIDTYAAKNTMILYAIGLHETPLAKICLEKVDMIYVIGIGEAKPAFDARTLKLISQSVCSFKAAPELVLLHEKAKKRPKQTKAWLKLADFGMHHHIRVAEEKDMARLVRFIRGQAVGVVLGGGGVRSWAHIGALKAILESGIPIDAIGGTSAGAIVGGYYCLHETYEDTHGDLQQLTNVTRKIVSLRDVTWPVVSLFDGKDYTLTQRRIFGKVQMEDLWLPFFSVSCNLSRSTQVMHRRGSLWKRIRSSTSVPGVFPPVVIRGQIHLDGGIINNLPVDLMKRMSSSIGTIIAVELIHKDLDETYYHFPPVLPLWKTVLTKLGWANKSYRFPGMIEMFLKSLLMGSSIKQKENSLAADILVTPDLSKYDLLKVSDAQESELVDLGYETALKAIKKWQRKNKFHK